ncbi:penicillin-binding protein 2 [Halioglobus japonicus]|uniref:Peptidoglycan D,D-transpeptidase MrdA n=1 Tax=Halioglobus japonicus TaxID=930805 RepID=A0AAP8MEI3_9GAMM|nr:penicillin-binding protein 2 [Halioglobus japonicus]AQA18009.1 penicillin-binding protein 2 [Halioglobus japonicus]PLW85999.1 penicillin-binding protein 2 [Halioglobus japonicus]GHD15024.1 peptidoglycan glycosyltransferase [Halioglobus japonicus]
MPQPIALKDPHRESRIYSARTVAAIIVVLGMLGVIFARYYSLQITDYQQYVTQSDRNRVQLQPLPPKRGLIYDRNGILLADNRPSFTLSVIKERVGDLEDTLSVLGELVPISDSEFERFQTRLKRRRPYEPVALRFRLTEEEQAALAVNRYRLPGVVVEAQLLRHYPHGELFSHALGYVGRINEREALELDESDYAGTDHVGKVGIEKYYEEMLHGDVGYQNVETNAHGRVLRVLERNSPKPGADIKLHLDIRLQQAAFDALGDRRGAVVAMDPKTGGILALVSTPGYDTNLFVNGISSKNYSALRDSPDVPLFNRAVQGQYPPGSTIKPMMGMAGLESGLVTPETTVPDPGWYSLPGDRHRYRDWILRIRGTGHAPEVDLKMAIAESCDTYFYDLGRRLTIDTMYEYLAPYGLGDRTGVDTTNERKGVLPSRRWKRDALGQPWYPGETISASIGQGYMLATPMQLAVATAVVASKGERRIPRFLQSINGEPQAATELAPMQASEDNWAAVYDGMLEVVHGKKGTAKALAEGIRYQMAGKTGTAQVIGIAQGAVYNEDEVDERHRHHGLFIAFAPAEAPTIAVAIIVENGGGSSAASPIARKVIDTWLFGSTDFEDPA